MLFVCTVLRIRTAGMPQAPAQPCLGRSLPGTLPHDYITPPRAEPATFSHGGEVKFKVDSCLERAIRSLEVPRLCPTRISHEPRGANSFWCALLT